MCLLCRADMYGGNYTDAQKLAIEKDKKKLKEVLAHRNRRNEKPTEVRN